VPFEQPPATIPLYEVISTGHSVPLEVNASVPWGVKVAVLAPLACFVAANVGAIGIVGVWSGIAPGTPKAHLLVISILAYQFLALGALLCMWIVIIPRVQGSLKNIGFGFPGWRTMIVAALSIIPIYFVVVLVSLFFDTFVPGFHLQGNTQQLVQGGGKLTRSLEVIVFLWGAVEAPIVEEFLFRVILFQGLRDVLARRVSYVWAIISGALISGIIFGAIHFELHSLPVLAVLGFALAIVFQQTRSYYCSTFVHMINNGIALIALFSIQ
jgi:membrane protease YdiL (CAAX protease family)